MLTASQTSPVVAVTADLQRSSMGGKKLLIRSLLNRGALASTHSKFGMC